MVGSPSTSPFLAIPTHGCPARTLTWTQALGNVWEAGGKCFIGLTRFFGSTAGFDSVQFIVNLLIGDKSSINDSFNEQLTKVTLQITEQICTAVVLSLRLLPVTFACSKIV